MVDDVDVTVALGEFDREVVDLENRRGIRGGDEPVGTPGFDGVQGGEPRTQGDLLGAALNLRLPDNLDLCSGCLGRDEVGFGLRLNKTWACRRCDECVGETLGQDVQPQNREHDRETGEQCRPPVAAHHEVAARSDDVAPRGGRVGNACLDEGQRSLENDRVGDEHRGEHHDGGHAVAGHVLNENPGGASAHDGCGRYVILAVLSHHVGAYDAGELGNVEERDREDQDRERAAEHGHEHGCERNPRERHDDVEQAHQDFGNPFATRRGDRTKNRGDEEREARGAESDHEGVPGAVHDTGEDVPALTVRSKEVIAARGLYGHSARKRVLAGHERRENRGEDDQCDEDKGDLRANRQGSERSQSRNAQAFGKFAPHDHTVLIRGLIST